MKKFATWLFAFVLLFSLALPTATHAKTGTMKLLVDGVEVEGTEQPFISNGQVLIPIENLFEEVGFQVTKGTYGQVSVTNSYLTVDFNATAQHIQINGKKSYTPFPLTLKNAGNYISDQFLADLEGFEVEVLKEENTVNVTTNRVQDVDAFLKKTLEAKLNSFSAEMVMDMNLETSTEELGSMDMKMDMKMDYIEEPMAMYMYMNMLANALGETEDLDTEMYFTEDGVYQKMDNVWVKDEVSQDLLEAQLDSANMLEQFELLKAFTKGVHIFEYKDSYVVVQNITTDEFKEMISEAMTLLPTLLPADLLGEDIQIPEATDVVDDKEVEATEIVTEEAAEAVTENDEAIEEVAEEVTENNEATEEVAEEVTENNEATEEVAEEVTENNEATEEVAEEVTENNEATEEVAEEVTENNEATEEVAEEVTENNEATEEESLSELDELLEMINLDIKKFHTVSTYDKATLFPLDMAGTIHITMSAEGEDISLKMTMSGNYKNHNNVKEIKVPEEVIKNAITMEQWFEELEKQWAAEEVPAE